MRLTAAQALVRFLAAQDVERDGVRQPLLRRLLRHLRARQRRGIGQALYERPDLLPYHQARNEQAMVHTAVGYARSGTGSATLACTTLDRARRDEHGHRRGARDRQPAAGAAAARRRLRVARPDPVLQQLEIAASRRRLGQRLLQPVSRYFDRIERPEQVIPAALAAMRVLTSPAETGAVTLAFRRTCRPRRSTSRTSSSRSASGTSRGRCPDADALARGCRCDPRGAAAADRRRRRRHLLRGDRRAAARFVRADRHPGRRDAGGQGLAALRPPVEPRRDRRDRHLRREPRSPPRPTS